MVMAQNKTLIIGKATAVKVTREQLEAEQAAKAALDAEQKKKDGDQ